MIAGESLAELLKRPFGGWMFGDVDVEQSPRANLHCNEHVQDAETSSDHREEVTGDNRLGVVPDKSGPAPRGGASWTARAAKILVNRARRDKNAEFQ